MSSKFSSKLRGAFRNLKIKDDKKDDAWDSGSQQLETPLPAASVQKTSVVHQPNDTLNEAFKYDDLDGSKLEIRLITVLPSPHFEAPVICLLGHADLDDFPDTHYEALSYTWGSFDNPATITVNDHQYFVTRGLHEAISYLRLPDAPRTLWIDAICINQLSISERNVQVLKMRDIYRRGQHTLIWLGPAFKDSDVLMDFMGWEDRRILDPLLDGIDNDYALARYDRAMKDPSLHYLWEALKKVTEVPYWSRMWIVQEVAFGASPQVCIGTKQVGYWDSLTRTISSIACELEGWQPGQPVNDIWAELALGSKPNLIAREREDLANPKTSKWFASRLVRYRANLATDPRDKVIALLGFLDENNLKYDDIVIDYARPVKDLYLDIFKFCIDGQRKANTQEDADIGSSTLYSLKIDITVDKADIRAAENEGRSLADSEIVTMQDTEVAISRAHGPVNILCAAGICNQGPDDADFPSWLPNWGQPQAALSIDDVTSNKCLTSGNSPPVFSISEDNKIFTSFGVQSMMVAHLGDKHEKLDPTPVELVQTISTWYKLAKKHAIKANPFHAQHFWRCIVLDSYFNRWHSEAPNEWYGIQLDKLISFSKRVNKTGKEKADTKTLMNEFILMCKQTTRGRRFALNVYNGLMMVPEQSEVGDIVVVLWGCDIPMVMRRVGGGQWILIGGCYVLGCMENGIILNHLVMAGIEAEDFHIR